MTNTTLKIGCQQIVTIPPSGRKFKENLIIKSKNHIRDALLCVNYAGGEIVVLHYQIHLDISLSSKHNGQTDIGK